MKKQNHIMSIMNTDFSATHQIDDSYVMNALHFHNTFEIYLAQTGGLHFFVDNRIYPVEKNDLFIFNHTDLHRIGIAANMHYDRYLIVFDPEYAADMCTSNTDLLECFLKRTPRFSHRVHLSKEQAEQFISLHCKAASHISKTQYGDDILAKLALAEILIFINRVYRENRTPTQEYSGTAYAKIKPILDYILENMNERLTLDQLAQQFYINKYYLCKLFKAVTGFSFNEYLTYHRIIRASELLRKNLPVSQVSEMAGFQNYCHFITTFKKIAGISPKQFAKGRTIG
ncbi:MAG: AraC family transcriptional regulator [Clostridiaceae bacterium]